MILLRLPKVRAVNLLCLTLSLAFLITAIAPAQAWNSRQIHWQSYKAGMTSAKKTGKPVLLVFEAKWCKVCKTYKKLFYNKKVVHLARKMVMIKINISKNRGLQKQYSIDGGYIPRTMALSPKGYHYSDLKGGDPENKYFLNDRHPGELLKMMRRAIARSK